jgi:hypothetical protein
LGEPRDPLGDVVSSSHSERTALAEGGLHINNDQGATANANSHPPNLAKTPKIFSPGNPRPILAFKRWESFGPGT